MRCTRLILSGTILAAVSMMIVSQAQTQTQTGSQSQQQAQTQTASQTQAKTQKKSRSHKRNEAQTGTQPQQQAQTPPEEKCLRALDGSCTNPALVEAARERAIIISSVRVSYFGTPAGTVGGYFIPFERLFRDDPIRFGLPTNTFVQPCCITRSK